MVVLVVSIGLRSRVRKTLAAHTSPLVAVACNHGCTPAAQTPRLT